MKLGKLNTGGGNGLSLSRGCRLHLSVTPATASVIRGMILECSVQGVTS
jgi:hypothetical protein